MKLIIFETDYTGTRVSDTREYDARPKAPSLQVIWDWFNADPELVMLKAVHAHGCHFEVHRA